MLSRTVYLVACFLTSGSTLLAADAATERQSRPRGRLTPELIKKFDANGDGTLDTTERRAARAAQAASQPAGTTPRERKLRGTSGGAKTSIGQKPLTEMSGDDRVRGREGGLYGGGRNEPPEALLAAAKTELAKIGPLDEAGKSSPDGKVVLLSLGMSNTTREFTPFKEAADADPQKSPHLVLVDGAFGGQAAAEWAEDVGKPVWKLAEQRLREADVTREQVQVMWLKQAVKSPLRDSMKNAEALGGYLTTIVVRAKERYPNLRIVYLSSRSFGGYSEKHGEPESFDTAFAVRDVIQDQQSGKAELNYDPARGEVKAPLLVWGPYLWADGDVPRKSDGLTWLKQDFVEDGTHPSPSGQRKVVDLLMKFFKTDPIAGNWFTAK